MLKLGKVFPYQQSTQSNCSAACLHAVLQHHGVDLPEELLASMIGVHKHGAELYQIVGAARACGLSAKQVEFGSLSRALTYVKNGFPIICDVRSYRYKNRGHYVVLAEVHGGVVEIMDPNVDGNWRSEPALEFDERWWDYEMYPPHMVLRRAGVLIQP